MADLIDRVELRKDFCNMCEAMQPEMIDCNKKGCISMQIIDEQPAVSRWISVEDDLPEIGYSVLVTRQTESNTRYIRIASRQDDCWMDDTDKYGSPNPHQVIAWMPMLDAYKPPEKE